MGLNTKISWCDATLNPWRGCVKVSPGCANCYAEVQAKRNPAALGEWGPGSKRVIGTDVYWRHPLQWNELAGLHGKKLKVFCGSMMDVFEDREDLVAPRRRLFELIDRTPNLIWLLLTKRPENIHQLWPGDADGEWTPRSNVWLGTTVENQEQADRRIPLLRENHPCCPVLFLSCEPLLEPITFRPSCESLSQKLAAINNGTADSPVLLAGIGWVIVGGESGPKARPFFDEWARGIMEQCRRVHVPFFFKQLGTNAWAQPGLDIYQARIETKDKAGADPAEWPEDLRVQEFPEVGHD